MSRLEHIAHFHQEFELPAEKSFSEEIIGEHYDVAAESLAGENKVIAAARSRTRVISTRVGDKMLFLVVGSTL